MAETGAFYLETVSGGTVVTKKSNGLFDCNAENGNATQHWTVQYDGDNDKKVAFQNASNGQWLRAMSGAAYGKIDTGDRSWWLLEEGPAPGSCFVKSTEFPDAYLCNANGSYVTNNQVYVWPKQAVWNHALTWYFKDANAPGFTPKSWSASAAGGSNKADLKEQDVSAQEAAQKKREGQLDAREKELDDREGSQSASAGGDEEAAKAQRANLDKKLQDLRAAERNLAAKEAAMAKQEQQNRAKEDELQRREAELAKAKVSSASGGASQAQVLKAENENLKLQLKIKDLERQLAEAQKASTSGSGAGSGSGSADQMAKLKDENARMKNLIAQQVLLQQQGGNKQPSSTASTAPSKSQSTAGGSTKPSPQTKPLAPNGPSAMPNGVSANTSKARTNEPSAGNAGRPTSSQPNGAAPRQPQPTRGGTTKANGSKPTSKGGSSPNKSELDELRAEIERLKAAMPNKTPAHAQAAKEEDDDAVVFDCGHVAYPPPRKVRKGMVGYLYVKSDGQKKAMGLQN